MADIRRAEERDLPGIRKLLFQVNQLHADVRPDLFKSGGIKYTDDELRLILADDSRPVWVAVNDADEVLGYAFCVLEEPVPSNNLRPHRTLYIDDICVDSAARGQHVATHLYEHVKAEAERLGCYNITLNVWAGNDGAQKFYEAMGMKPRKTMMETILGD